MRVLPPRGGPSQESQEPPLCPGRTGPGRDKGGRGLSAWPHTRLTHADALGPRSLPQMPQCPYNSLVSRLLGGSELVAWLPLRGTEGGAPGPGGSLGAPAVIRLITAWEGTGGEGGDGASRQAAWRQREPSSRRASGEATAATRPAACPARPAWALGACRQGGGHPARGLPLPCSAALSRDAWP